MDSFHWQKTLQSLIRSPIEPFSQPFGEKEFSEPFAQVLVATHSDWTLHEKHLKNSISAWDWKSVLLKPRQSHRLSSSRGPLWLIRVGAEEKESKKKSISSAQSFFSPSHYSRGRDLGGVISQLLLDGKKTCDLHIHLVDSSDDSLILGLLVGIEMGLYRFQRVVKEEWPAGVRVKISREKGGEVFSDIWVKAQMMAAAVNLSRHLVNLPPNWLTPENYAQAIVSLFSSLPSSTSSLKISVWDEDKLEAEKMGLLLAVGRGASSPPRMVHLCYRPETTTETDLLPIAFVGKGVTFDSGGLDIKPASAMRLMKKDMGGSASLVGLAWWMVNTQYKIPCDFYLPLAENGISGKSFRPGDILRGRNGQDVEIHNTDAEGRLLLADALDVAIRPPHGEKPRYVLDVATLTGAIKAALGTEVAGLFSNDDCLAKDLLAASQESGDFCWHMPLYQPYRTQMSSSVAERTNAVDGFGGAITAALFLESYVEGMSWAHFDIYAWKDKPEGAYQEPGGSGQLVQCLIQWLEKMASNKKVEMEK